MTSIDDAVADLLVETRDEINRADSKSNLLLTGAGLAVAALAAGLISGQINPVDARGFVQVLAIASATLLLAGLVAVGAAVFPRLGTPEPGCARYFMEIAQFDNTDALSRAISADPAAQLGRHLQQVLVLSKAVRRKYRLVRASEVLLGLGVAAAAAAGIVHVAMT